MLRRSLLSLLFVTAGATALRAQTFRVDETTIADKMRTAGYRTARTVDTGTHTAADNLETLPAVLFSQYANHYRTNVELAAAR